MKTNLEIAEETIFSHESGADLDCLFPPNSTERQAEKSGPKEYFRLPSIESDPS